MQRTFPGPGDTPSALGTNAEDGEGPSRRQRVTCVVSNFFARVAASVSTDLPTQEPPHMEIMGPGSGRLAAISAHCPSHTAGAFQVDTGGSSQPQGCAPATSGQRSCAFSPMWTLSQPCCCPPYTPCPGVNKTSTWNPSACKGDPLNTALLCLAAPPLPPAWAAA